MFVNTSASRSRSPDDRDERLPAFAHRTVEVAGNCGSDHQSLSGREGLFSKAIVVGDENGGAVPQASVGVVATHLSKNRISDPGARRELRLAAGFADRLRFRVQLLRRVERAELSRDARRWARVRPTSSASRVVSARSRRLSQLAASRSAPARSI